MKGMFRSAALLAVCFICLLCVGCSEDLATKADLDEITSQAILLGHNCARLEMTVEECQSFLDKYNTDT